MLTRTIHVIAQIFPAASSSREETHACPPVRSRDDDAANNKNTPNNNNRKRRKRSIVLTFIAVNFYLLGGKRTAASSGLAFDQLSPPRIKKKQQDRIATAPVDKEDSSNSTNNDMTEEFFLQSIRGRRLIRDLPMYGGHLPVYPDAEGYAETLAPTLRKTNAIENGTHFNETNTNRPQVRVEQRMENIQSSPAAATAGIVPNRNDPNDITARESVDNQRIINRRRHDGVTDAVLSRPLNAHPVDYGDVHPWAKYQRQHGRGSGSGTGFGGSRIRRRRLHDGDDERRHPYYRPLRITFEYDAVPEGNHQYRMSPEDARPNMIAAALENAAKIWSDSLEVVPVHGPLVLTGTCKNTDVPPMSSEGKPQRERKIYGADVVIYVSFSNGRSCGTDAAGSGLYSIGAPCEFDQFDRPIAGTVTFCLDHIPGPATPSPAGGAQNRPRLRGHRRRREKSVPLRASRHTHPPTTEHDERTVWNLHFASLRAVGDVLGLHPASVPYYRHAETGEPRTPRPLAYERATCVDGTTRRIVRSGPETSASRSAGDGSRSYLLTSPSVRSVLWEGLGCRHVEGIALGRRILDAEDSHYSCLGDYWADYLLVDNSFSGTSLQISPLALALLRDSGWYRTKQPPNNKNWFDYGNRCEILRNPP